MKPWPPICSGPGRLGLAAAAERQRLLRLGELALEPAALVDQAATRAGTSSGEALSAAAVSLSLSSRLVEPVPRRLAGQRLDPAHARGDRAFAR